MGLGIPLIGLLSDLLAPAYSTESLHYALFALPISYLIASILFLLAGRRMNDPVEDEPPTG